MEQVLFFILMIGVLIIVHEYGHYLLARLMGVHVVEFAIGVGPKVLKLKSKPRKIGDVTLPPTEFTIGALPFGGFVRMLGTDPHEEVPPEIESVSFNARPVWRRFLIMIAGPAFNILLALAIYFASGLGTAELDSSLMGAVDDAGPAASAGMESGDRIVAIDGEEVRYFWQLQSMVEAKVRPIEGEDDRFEGVPLQLTWERRGERRTETVTPAVFIKENVPDVPALGTTAVGRIGVKLENVRPLIAVTPGSTAAAAGLRNWDRIIAIDGVAVDTLPKALDALYKAGDRVAKVSVLGYEAASVNGYNVGIAGLRMVDLPADKDGVRGIFTAECLVHAVLPGSPADTAGLQSGDRLVSFQGTGCRSWDFFQQRLRVAGTKGGELAFERDGVIKKAQLGLASAGWPNELKKDATIFAHGIRVLYLDAPIEVIANEDRVSYAWHAMGSGITGAVTSVLSTLGALFSGSAKLEDSVMGPAGMMQLAGMSVERGWGFFFALMAGFSVSLGIINLLPVPILDGGQILFLAIEGIRRKPVSMRVRMIATYAGLAFIILLMIIVTRNDINRCIG